MIGRLPPIGSHFLFLGPGKSGKSIQCFVLGKNIMPIVLKCGRISEGKYPIDIYEDLTAFKAYYSDVGLLTIRMALSANSILHSANLSDKARGMISESYVAEQLSGSSFPSIIGPQAIQPRLTSLFSSRTRRFQSRLNMGKTLEPRAYRRISKNTAQNTQSAFPPITSLSKTA